MNIGNRAPEQRRRLQLEIGRDAALQDLLLEVRELSRDFATDPHQVCLYLDELE
jgi:hypothetical protein